MLDKSVASILLDEFPQELLQHEVLILTQGWNDPEVRTRYTALLREVESGTITEERLVTLGDLLEIVLESGRARHLYGPAGENALTALFQKTPRGAALTQQAQEVNRALTGLASQTLGGLAFRASGPGSWVLTLQTNRCELTMRIDRQGLRVVNMEMDLGS